MGGMGFVKRDFREVFFREETYNPGIVFAKRDFVFAKGFLYSANGVVFATCFFTTAVKSRIS